MEVEVGSEWFSKKVKLCSELGGLFALTEIGFMGVYALRLYMHIVSVLRKMGDSLGGGR